MPWIWGKWKANVSEMWQDGRGAWRLRSQSIEYILHVVAEVAKNDDRETAERRNIEIERKSK